MITMPAITYINIPQTEEEVAMITRRILLISGALAGCFASISWPRALMAAGKPPVMLYKTPGCGCCEDYAAHLGQHGFKVTVKEAADLASISARAGIPADLQGCHTAFIGDYVIDGHVPVGAIQKLLAEHPALKGLTLPGMPPGSPGMAGTKEGPFTVYAIDKQGQKTVYMTV
jgi:hypothetical protein